VPATRSRWKRRNKPGDLHRHGQFPEKAAGYASHEDKGEKDHDGAQEEPTMAGITSGWSLCHLLLVTSVVPHGAGDLFNNHDGIIDDEADGAQCAKRHDVEVMPARTIR